MQPFLFFYKTLQGKQVSKSILRYRTLHDLTLFQDKRQSSRYKIPARNKPEVHHLSDSFEEFMDITTVTVKLIKRRYLLTPLKLTKKVSFLIEIFHDLFINFLSFKFLLLLFSQGEKIVQPVSEVLSSSLDQAAHSFSLFNITRKMQISNIFNR